MTDFHVLLPEPPPEKKANRSVSTMLKLALIGFLFLLLQIPLMMSSGLVEERERYNEQVQGDIAGSWGKSQVLVGPVLSVPYRVHYTDDKNQSRVRMETLHILPEKININGDIKPEELYRGIYKSVVYSSELRFDGSFAAPDLKQQHIDPKDVLWDDASVTIGLSDMRGIQKRPVLSWQKQPVSFSPGAEVSLFDSGMHAPVKLAQSGTSEFSYQLSLKGSTSIQFFPGGKENKIHLASSWKHPSFIGGFLPVSRSVSDKGFTADWEVSYFARNFPQMWSGQEASLRNALSGTRVDVTAARTEYTTETTSTTSGGSGNVPALAGVSLITPVDFYQTCTRAAKYGSLFIVLTFMTYFLFETVVRVRIHAFQYILVGLALSLFYLLLISLSEVIGFAWAYTAASLPTILLISLYTRAFTRAKNKFLSWIMAALLAVVYIYLYVLLQLEQLSLLFGSIGLFAMLASVMYVTRNIDWYGTDTMDPQEGVSVG